MMQAEMNVKLSDESLNEVYAQIRIVALQAIDDAASSTEKIFYTQKEVMDMLRCGREQLNKYYAQGLPSIQQGRTILIQKQDLISFMNTLKN